MILLQPPPVRVLPRGHVRETIDIMESARERIQREVSRWDGVTVEPHRFGGVEFRVGRRELGHLHGSRMADLPFPMKVRNDLIAAGRASAHHVLPDTGWVSFYMHKADDADAAIALFRLNYDRPWLTAREKGAKRIA